MLEPLELEPLELELEPSSFGLPELPPRFFLTSSALLWGSDSKLGIAKPSPAKAVAI